MPDVEPLNNDLMPWDENPSGAGIVFCCRFCRCRTAFSKMVGIGAAMASAAGEGWTFTGATGKRTTGTSTLRYEAAWCPNHQNLTHRLIPPGGA